MNAKVSGSYSVYPGEFVTAMDETSIIEQMKDSQDDNINLPYVNIKEFIDEYHVEIAAPGVTRDKLMVYADDNLLLVCTTQNERIMQRGKSFQRHVSLPADADTELAVAEYKNNILNCYIPKTKKPARHACTRIVVY